VAVVHGADGSGRCFPGYLRSAAAAKCHRDTVCEALKALEEAGIMTWVHRITRIRRRERDLFGDWGSVWQVIRTSNAYRFVDPLDRRDGRNTYKSENPARPPNQEKKKDGARLVGAQVMSEKPSRSPPVPPDTPVIALRREHGSSDGELLAALIARQDAGIATAADWRAYERAIAAKISARPR
jgi:hypothetical protein